VNIEIMRASGRSRRMLSSREDLARKADVLGNKYDAQCQVVAGKRQLMAAPTPQQKNRWIGFRALGEADDR
jgi:hypothetical protein